MVNTMSRTLARKAAYAALSMLTYAQLSVAEVQVEYYVSPTGDDNNPGTLQQPFQSLDKARNQVRTINTSMTGDIVVNLAAGDYYLDKSFSLTELDSGFNGHHVIYQNNDAPGSARIIGGKALSNWQHYSGDIYRTYVGNMTFESLFVNGSRATLARHPNSGYLHIEKADSAEPRKAFYHKAGDMPAIADISDLQIYVWPGAHDWANEILPIVSISQERKVTLSQNQRFAYLGDLKAKSRYFIQGAYELLDQPGEFYLNKAEGYLYYYPVSNDVDSEEVIAPTVSKTVHIKGKNTANLVENLQIRGLTVMVSDYHYSALNGTSMGNIILANAKNIVIADNKITNAALNGVAMSASGNSFVHNISITGNDIFDVGSSGVVARGKGNTKNYVSTGHLISNNRIKNIASIATNGAGVQIANVAHSTISYNEIANAVHYGIEVKGSRWMQLPSSIDGEAVTEENKYDFNPGRYNVVEFNRVYNVNLDTQDTGIYKSGATYQTTVNNNLFYDSGAAFGIQKGIYLDDVSDYTFVTNNIVYGLSDSHAKNPAMNVKGTGNVIRNNVFHFDNTGMRLLEFNNLQSQDNTVERNIFYSTTANLVYDFATTYDSKLVSAADHNLFFTPGQGIFKPLPGGDNTLAGWQSLDNNKYDQHSLVADPLFVNPSAHDYRLQAGSPALTQLGFKQISTDNIGLKPSFIYADHSVAEKTMLSIEEDFEDNFANWTIATLGTPSQSTLKAHKGSSSYAPDEDKDQIGYQLPQATNGLVSVWFYDDADDTSMKVKAQVSAEQANVQIGVITYNSSDYYSYLLEGKTFATSSVPRTTGWHKFSFDLTSGVDCKLYIDGKLIGSTTKLTAATNIILGDNAADGKQGQVFFDDLTLVTDMHDSFEQGLDNWTIAQLGTASVSSEQAHSGAKAYVLDEGTDQIGYSLPQAVHGVVAVNFYDDADDTDMKVKAMVADSANNNVQIGVVTYKSKDKYAVLLEGKTFLTSTVSRTTGWHEFRFDLSSGDGAKLYIDNVLVGTADKMVDIARITLGDNANDGKSANVYFDDVRVFVEPNVTVGNQYTTTAKEAWDSLISPAFARSPEMAYVENDANLPNVLLYGDSISIHYTQEVRELLADKANVYRIANNGADSRAFILRMNAMLNTMTAPNVQDHWDFDWDVIHFNVGLHDLKYLYKGKLDLENGTQVRSVADYKTNLAGIVAYLKKLAPNAKLIFATSTPVPQGAEGRVAGDAAIYNTGALEVMAQYPEIDINDLFSLSKPNQQLWWVKAGDVHYNSKGQQAQGQQVASFIDAAL